MHKIIDAARADIGPTTPFHFHKLDASMSECRACEEELLVERKKVTRLPTLRMQDEYVITRNYTDTRYYINRFVQVNNKYPAMNFVSVILIMPQEFFLCLD